jgi:hypothetical protein
LKLRFQQELLSWLVRKHPPSSLAGDVTLSLVPLAALAIISLLPPSAFHSEWMPSP